MKIAKIGIIRKRDCPEPRRIGREMAEWFAVRGVETVLDRIEADQDLLIVLGGDGTLLHVAAESCGHGIPVLGINLGGLGFLTEVAVEDRLAMLDKIMAGELVVEERMMLRVRLCRGDQAGSWFYALNDVVISKGAVDRISGLEAWVDDEYLATYRADGLIIASSTGSTAYNLSAGGPIVHPRLNAIVVTPICPFMLESRPVLLDGSHLIRVRLSQLQSSAKNGGTPGTTGECQRGNTAALQVIVDGQKQAELQAGDTLEIAAAEKKLRLVTSPWQGYFAILRGKLNWGAGYSFSAKA